MRNFSGNVSSFVRRLVPDRRVMALLITAIAALMCLSPRAAARRPQLSDHALPFASEQLEHPYVLDHCMLLQIVEWKPTAALADATTPTPAALTIVDEACKAALERYPAFLQQKKLATHRQRPIALPALSLLPANTLLDGKDSRNLNDLPTRFGQVVERCCYWGLYVDSLDHVFMRNDPLERDSYSGRLRTNPRFVRTLHHEMAHVLNARLGVWDFVAYDRKLDEQLAEEFVAYVGMLFPTESCADDLAFHRGLI